MDFNRRIDRRGKGTRPFMPVRGKKSLRHLYNGKVMKVGDDAMIDDSKSEGDPGDMPEAVESGGGEIGSGGEAGMKKMLFEEIKAERDNYLDLARRERADFDNYRKRIEREMKQIKKESLASFLKEFFAPLDDLGRVLQETEKSQSFESLATGVRILDENFWRTLAKAGVRRIDAKGRLFDPTLHEAVAVVPSSDVPPNTVLEVYDNGYKLDDHILRPARVVVSKAPENDKA